MKAVVAIVAVLVLADVAFAGTLIAHRAESAVQVAKNAPTHPCNHGFYVSQAAHAKKHGQSNSDAARSKLGKDGSCSTKAPGS
jgi:hypothetical protein